MAGCYFVIVDARDKEKFRLFKQSATIVRPKDISLKAPKGGTVYGWALAKSATNKIWPDLKENDVVFFGLESARFEYQGLLLGKDVNDAFSARLWGTDARTKTLDHLLIFKELKPCSFGYNQMLRYGDVQGAKAFPGIYKVQARFVKQLLGKQSETKQLSVKHLPKPVRIPVDYGKPPAKARAKVLRFIRDTRKSKLLKRKYENRCQVCNYRLEITDRVYYSEVHHLYPLKDGGPDSFDNMIVLCPTHHAEFDFKIIGIKEDGRTVIDKNGKAVAKLTIHDDHVLNERNLRFQLSGIRSS